MLITAALRGAAFKKTAAFKNLIIGLIALKCPFPCCWYTWVNINAVHIVRQISFQEV
jgi:hypothetical protein